MEAGVEWGDRADKTLLLSLVEKALRYLWTGTSRRFIDEGHHLHANLYVAGGLICIG